MCQFGRQRGVSLPNLTGKRCQERKTADLQITSALPLLRVEEAPGFVTGGLTAAGRYNLILKLLYFDPFRLRNFRCPWQAGAGDDHFVMNFPGDVKARKELIEEVEAAKLRQDNQRG